MANNFTVKRVLRLQTKEYNIWGQDIVSRAGVNNINLHYDATREFLIFRGSQADIDYCIKQVKAIINHRKQSIAHKKMLEQKAKEKIDIDRAMKWGCKCKKSKRDHKVFQKRELYVSLKEEPGFTATAKVLKNIYPGVTFHYHPVAQLMVFTGRVPYTDKFARHISHLTQDIEDYRKEVREKVKEDGSIKKEEIVYRRAKTQAGLVELKHKMMVLKNNYKVSMAKIRVLRGRTRSNTMAHYTDLTFNKNSLQ